MIKTGIVASEGISIGKAYLFTRATDELIISDHKIGEDDIASELDKVKKAIDQYKEELTTTKTINQTQEDIINAHIEMLKDPFLEETLTNYIEKNLYNSEKAFNETLNDMIGMLENLEDEYLRARANDYRDIKEQILFKLKDIKPNTLTNLPKDSIVVAEELTPSDTSSMDIDNIKGFATDTGGKTDHTSIIAQTLNLPAIVGLGDASTTIKDGDLLILDARSNKIFINPDKTIIEEYRLLIEELELENIKLAELKDKDPITKDKHQVELVANIGNLDDLDLGLEAGAQGVGLFRTEFLYMNNTDFPSEEEQFEVYKEAASKLKQDPLIIRTLDIGGDKSLPYFEFPEEENPFLGWRALRLCFDKRDVFDAQLKAILRASAYGNVKILLPMIVSVEEVIKVKEIIKELMEDLDHANIDYDKDIDIGIMIETPASAIIADQLIDHVDYFSIGTNDLTQYVLSADRGNEKVANIYSNYHPAVLRLIKRVIDVSHEAGKWTGMCGGFASDTKATKLLLGLGLDEFSATAGVIPQIKDIIRNTNFKDAEKYADKVLSLGNVTDIKKFINK